ncbi:hypothetical protein PGT21_002208 [Puccinia graminis f. sp. tritici]|uniref:Uncharacterized protein n=2 Tax=Puccinia graminis f. sp. tritici TaxID=56615 RepID=E3K9E0_PUCGT|nr:uncharacterized protein PGTG_07131 [Puccinia graminis f. sp. tritici CRL 75-36-700-3]EFP80879.1 hypothetical protein PGTG_07131 [Puccinia graminis f. sp. tritici CRL 75-36-700-3]KAA1080106.1 hypothetical protein PGTUg99_011572 [Puccinia graminis f. sp. tritici]KAA1103838.1 hypothetical protein PGT21_002208 [Puccinia graminis f. sp. tritici]
MKVQNSEGIRAYFPIHGIHALCSRIEYPPIVQEGDCEKLAYGAKHPGVILSRFFARSQWKLTLAKLQRNPNDSGIRARLTKLRERVSKLSNFQNHVKDRNLDANYLSVSISCIDTCHTTFALYSRPTIITVGIKQLRRANGYHSQGIYLSEDCLWSVTEEFVFRENNRVWCCNTVPPLSALLEIPRIAIHDSFFLAVQIKT